MPREIEQLDIAFVFGRDTDSLAANTGSIKVMQQRIDEVRANFPYYATTCGEIYSSLTEQSKKEAKFVLYPNPASETLAIKTDIRFPVTLELYDVIGRKVMSQSVSSNNQGIDISKLSKGFLCCNPNIS